VDPFGRDEEDAWPDEPAEFDPDSLGPETPDVEPDLEASLPAAEDIDRELVRAFWGAAVFLNIALAAFALGAMLIYFRGDWSTGISAGGVGVVAALFTLRFYLDFTLNHDDSSEDETEADP
jgi:hypothetical protein